MKKPSPRPEQQGGFDIDRVEAVPLLRVLHTYGLLDQMIERGSTASGPSPFCVGGALLANLARNTWDDTGGRLEIEGRVVDGDVVGLVQAIEDVPRSQALKILHQVFVLGVRRQARSLMPDVSRAREVKALEELVFDVPFLRRIGVSPSVASTWGVGWCPAGELAGRIAFPIRSAAGILVGYAGLDPTDSVRWRLTVGVDVAQGLFGIERVHHEPRVRDAVYRHGITLVDNPLEVVRAGQCMALPVVSPVGSDLTEFQIARLLDSALNPTQRLVFTGPNRHRRMLALHRHAWRQRAAALGRR